MSTGIATTDTPDVVVLVPGFLGFTRFGGFYYFADRLIAVIRGLLESRLGYPVPVVPVKTLPTHSLAARQDGLIEELRTLCNPDPSRRNPHPVAGVQRVHLVGHSTGGVDVQLVACTKRLGAAPQGEAREWPREAKIVRGKIASVVTISAPHHGTYLADTRLARWGENPLLHPTAIVPELATLVHLLMLIPRDLAATAGLGLAAPNDVLRFMWQIASHRELIADLRPARMEARRNALEQDRRIPLTCFVTGTAIRNDARRPSDPFYKDMYQLTAGDGRRVPSSTVKRCGDLLNQLILRNPGLVLAGAEAQMPVIDATLNDGIVNTTRQLVHSDRPGEVGGFIVADHADVLGHYDRRDSMIEGAPYNAGLFHSGAGFGDDQFFALYRRVADAIVGSIPGAGSVAVSRV